MLCAFDGQFEDIECVYAVLSFRMEDEKYDILYVGETKNLNTHLTNHHRKKSWRMANATHLFVKPTKLTKQQRREVVRSIAADYDPRYNRRYAH